MRTQDSGHPRSSHCHQASENDNFFELQNFHYCSDHVLIPSTILTVCAKLGSPPITNVSVLTSDGALQSAVVIKSDDCHFIGWPVLLFPVLPATQAAAKAHRSQTTQKQQGANHHQQPARSPGHGELWGLLASQPWHTASSVCILILVYFIEYNKAFIPKLSLHMHTCLFWQQD